jgi:NADPH:quinone reductase-like Zn-dependent oxidoreductase
MLAARIHGFGGLEGIVLEDIPIPGPAADELLIRLRAASVNPAEVLMTEGRFPRVTARDLPMTLGSDAAGIVMACGSLVRDFKVGDAVYGMSPIGKGAFAQHVILHHEIAARAPAYIDLADAAALPLAALTAWQGLFDHGGLASGQDVAIVGAAGGVGHLAVQMARVAGARVFAVASRQNLPFLGALGAHELVGRDEDMEGRLKQVDLILDLAGGPFQDQLWSTLTAAGRIVSPVRAPNESLRVASGQSGLRFVCKPSRDGLELITGLVNSGQLRATIAQRYPFRAVGTALARIKAGGLQGKILIDGATG